MVKKRKLIIKLRERDKLKEREEVERGRVRDSCPYYSFSGNNNIFRHVYGDCSLFFFVSCVSIDWNEIRVLIYYYYFHKKKNIWA